MPRRDFRLTAEIRSAAAADVAHGEGGQAGSFSEFSIRCVLGFFLSESVYTDQRRAAPAADLLVLTKGYEEFAASRAGVESA